MSDFTKYQALGNDYLVLDPQRVEFTATAESVRLLCDRHVGVGADGVLIGPLGVPRPGAPVELRIFNSDGSACEKSGNGLRMFALYLAENYEAARPSVVLRTVAGDSRAEVLDFAAGRVLVEMGLPAFEEGVTSELAVGDQRLTVTSLHLGNPHTVVVRDEVSAPLAKELGPLIAWHPRFAAGTNVQFARVVDRGTIEIEVWERGAGYTLASGSSACAAAAATHRLGLVDGRVTVEMAGGSVGISIGEDGAVTMTGEAEPVAEGRFAPAFLDRLRAAAADGRTVAAVDGRRTAA
ncbi:diaminopimelate epimerase [Streptomyces sp. ISL-43]|uniref:diaminopimelate epimerase n=1 Tax=Streptomyces sp. ISL-43 TaxID=2819183 RepID=UPI001BE986F6|nr:diaminopimelate epimerase [Streptomyces sp. ISL-43]MBT2447841.1 diaminopimelate epimerase [Streptomyces sp. ISL-43]